MLWQTDRQNEGTPATARLPLASPATFGGIPCFGPPPVGAVTVSVFAGPPAQFFL